ncbi:MAG: hypothetical protein CVU04_05155 [Bacteroidetes bacterium HGW-Bacteroidetes-20]|nr:MAG: hypothetical protein CVU04_05155 [Bacteroidetes bacterium HGW-Bacteroidetes-20]
MKKLFILIIAFMCVSISVEAQEKTRKELKGDQYSFNYSYDKAILKYTHTNDLTIEGKRNLATAYLKTGKIDKAELVYADIIKSTSGIIAEDYYNYSSLLRSAGKYFDANIQMDQFAKLKPNDLRVIDYLANKDNLQKYLTNNNEYNVTVMKINSSDQDFAPAFYKDQIVFASTRAKMRMIKKTYNLNGKPFLNMYVSNLNEEQLRSPKNFDRGLNTKLHDGPASFNKEGTYMAYTRNHNRDKSNDKVVELQIFFSTFVDGKWTTETPFNQNNESYNVEHPSLSADGKTMFFVSDMPGGYGGTDIYRSIKNAQGEWGKSENLGDQINTEGDEIFPFLEEVNGVLFFSSNGRFGLGGQDIFIVKIDKDGVFQVQNAGFPLNSQYDDFAVIANPNSKKGYFSSNREGGSGDDDIYGVEFTKLFNIVYRIEGIAMDENKNPIPSTIITLQDEEGKIIETIFSNELGAFRFIVESNKNYKLIGKKEMYNDGETITNTNGKNPIVKADVMLSKVLDLKPIEIVETKKEVIAKKIETETDLRQIGEIENIYFDLGKYNLRPDAVIELDKIVEIMNDHPNLSIEISAYTDCRESKSFNMILSENRAKTSAWYIKQRITNPSRVSSKGYGEAFLTNGCSCEGEVVSDCPESEHQLNRRSEFTIVKK